MTFYDGLKTSLEEAIDFTKGTKKLHVTKVSIVPVKKYSSREVKQIRTSHNMSQSVFAGYLGINKKRWKPGKWDTALLPGPPADF